MNGATLERLCIHTATTKPLPLARAVEEYARSGVQGITVWEDALEGVEPDRARKLIADAGLQVVSLCRGGFFVDPSATIREERIEHNRTLIRSASRIGAPLLVLVCGAHPEVPLAEARSQIRAGIEAVLPLAVAEGVRLAVEPLHPMYADTRSAINTLGSANDLVEAIDDDHAGVAIDVYHLWWDPELEREVARCGDNIMAFHVSDWRSPTRHLLTDRALMGDGCIPIREIRRMVEEAGFDGFIEVEIFSEEHWSEDQPSFVRRIVQAYQNHV